MEIRSPDGSVLYRNERLRNEGLGGSLIPGEGDGGYFPRSARLADGTRVRMVSRRHNLNGRALVIRLAYSEETIWARFEDIHGVARGIPIRAGARRARRILHGATSARSAGGNGDAHRENHVRAAASTFARRGYR